MPRSEPPALALRRFQAGDRSGWTPLWHGYLDFYQATLADDVTEHLWSNLTNPGGAVRGYGAFVERELVGIVHYLFHPSTWSRTGYCYLEDLFTAPAARVGGVGRALIAAVVADAKAAGMAKVYWQTHETNAVAQVLYNRVARRSGFVVYEITP